MMVSVISTSQAILQELHIVQPESKRMCLQGLAVSVDISEYRENRVAEEIA